MRKVFEMTSNNIKLWMEGKRTMICIRDEQEDFSAMEIEDLIDTLVALRPKRQEPLE